MPYLIEFLQQLSKLGAIIIPDFNVKEVEIQRG